MHDILLFIKTYKNDFASCKRLLDSIIEYNKDNIAVLISVNDEDHIFFKNNLPADFEIIKDSEIISCTNPSPWKYQQVIKSQLHRINIAENYVCLDSDSYFIKDFYAADFIQDGVPYTVIHQQKELFSWLSLNHRRLKQEPRKYFEDINKKIMTKVGRNGICYDFGPSPTIWSNQVWKSFQDNYLSPTNTDYCDLIDEYPSEFTWYGEWLLKSGIIPILPKEPLFKVFHYREQFLDFRKEGHTRETVKENYLGIILQSNWNNNLKWYQRRADF